MTLFTTSIYVRVLPVSYLERESPHLAPLRSISVSSFICHLKNQFSCLFLCPEILQNVKSLRILKVSLRILRNSSRLLW